MEDEHVIPGEEAAKNAGGENAWKKILLILGGFVLLAGIGIGSYFLGRGKPGTSDISPTPVSVLEATIPTDTPTSVPTEADTSGSPTPTPTPTPSAKSKILSSTSTLDGFRSSNGGGNQTVEVRAGRNENLVTRGMLSFSLADIPSGAVITEATLRLYQAKIIGNPYGVGGSIKIDHLTYGDSLDNADYGAAALSSSFTTLTGNSAIEWKDANVTDRVKDDLANGRSSSQFRIHFQIENTGGNVTGDFAYFEAAENNMGTGYTPQLVVKYY